MGHKGVRRRAIRKKFPGLGSIAQSATIDGWLDEADRGDRDRPTMGSTRPEHWNPERDKKIFASDSRPAEDRREYFIPEVELVGDPSTTASPG